jgi:hypothetical protein
MMPYFWAKPPSAAAPRRGLKGPAPQEQQPTTTTTSTRAQTGMISPAGSRGAAPLSRIVIQCDALCMSEEYWAKRAAFSSLMT